MVPGQLPGYLESKLPQLSHITQQLDELLAEVNTEQTLSVDLHKSTAHL